MSSPSNAGSSRGRNTAIGVLAAICLLLLALPEIVRLAAIKAMPSTGLGDAMIDDVDINLFSGTVAVDQLSLNRDGASKLEVDRVSIEISWLKLLLGELHIERALVDGVRLAVVEADDGSWEVVIPLADDKKKTATTVDEQALVLPKIAVRTLRLSNAQLDVQSPMIEGVLTIDELELGQASTWLQQQASLQLAAAWNGAPVTLNLNAQPWQQTPRVDGRLRLSQFQLAGLTLTGSESLQGMVNLDIRFNAEKALSGDIASVLEGQISLDKFATLYRQIAIDHEELVWRGSLDLRVSDKPLAYSLAGNLQSSGLSVVDQLQQASLLEWDTVSMDAVTVDQALNVSAEQIRLLAVNAVNSASEDLGKVYTGAVTVKDLTLEQGRVLVIGDARIQDGQYHVVVTPDGKLRIDSVLTPVLHRLQQRDSEAATAQSAADHVDEKTDPDQKTHTQASAAADFMIAVKQFNVSDDSYIKFTDQRFPVPVQQQLNIQQLSVTNIDQREPMLPATLTFLGGIGEFSTLEIGGQAKPFAKKPELSVKGALKAMELPGISPYSEAYIGYHLTRGQYDHQFELDIANDEIKLDNALLLRQLALESVDPNKPQPVEKQLDVPLALALDMLRDSEDNIKLNVPIAGRMDDPSINVNAIVNNALGNALKNGAASYLTLALQPYGAVLMAADFVGEQLSTVRLDPIVFAAGAVELLPQQLDYTGKITALLQDRPKLTLTICGRANANDKQFLAQKQRFAAVEEAQLAALAEQRANAVKREFIDKGIDNQRLFLCQPQYRPEATSAVTLTM